VDTEGTNQALAAAGVIDYMSPHEIPAMIHPYIARAARMLSEATGKDEVERASVPWKADPEAIVDRIYRSARAISPEEGMGRLSQTDEGAAAAGRLAGPGGDNGGRARAEPPAQPAGRLAEERPDATDEATDAVGKAAIAAVPRGATWSEKAANILGIGRGSPGVGDHFFNIINKNFTAPHMKVALDRLSQPKWAAELAKFRDAAVLLHGYRDGLDSWQGKPVEQ
jgi:hypothetical protein